jgi:hypothetical protein
MFAASCSNSPNGIDPITWNSEVGNTFSKLSKYDKPPFTIIETTATGKHQVTIPQRKVLAFYYPWYGSPTGPSKDYVHWSEKAPHDTRNFPTLGLYDSHDPKIVAQHIEWAKAAGIDGFISSWWGIGTHEDRAMPILLAEAAKAGNFEISVYMEGADKSPTEKYDRALALKRTRYILDQYAKHPNFLHSGDEPVLFYYVRAIDKIKGRVWKSMFQELRGEGRKIVVTADLIVTADPPMGEDVDLIDAFDGLHFYVDIAAKVFKTDSPMIGEPSWESTARAVHAAGKHWAATTIPGFWHFEDDKPALQRLGASTYLKSWYAAAKSGADWLLITSFNEWHEGSEIEPSREHGETYLYLTRVLSALWKDVQ